MIGIFRELVDYGNNIKEKNEGYSERNKEKSTGNQQWREGYQDPNQQFGADGRKKHLTRTEWRKKNSKKWGELRNLPDTLKRANIQIIGVPEGKEEEQETENLLEKIMENFPNLAKETDF